MVRFISIVTNEYIPAGRTVQWYAANTEFIYVEALDSLQVDWGTSNVTLHADNWLLAQRLTVHNSSSTNASIRTVRFQVEPDVSYRLITVISRLQAREAASLMELFSPLFYDRSRIEEIEVLAGHLFEGWCNDILSKDVHTLTPPDLHGQIDPRLIKINRYLRNHCEEVITLQQLADLIQCNPVYLSNMYSRVFHISPIKDLQKMKMEKAKKLLHSSDMSVGEVSQRLGYISASQFSDLFKRHYGVTPLLFRRNSRMTGHDR